MHVETTKNRLFSGICFAVSLVAMIVVGFASGVNGAEENVVTDVNEKKMDTFCGHYHFWGSSETTGFDNKSCKKPEGKDLNDSSGESIKSVTQFFFCSHTHKFGLDSTTPVAGSMGVLDWCADSISDAPLPTSIYSDHYHNNASTGTTRPHE